MTYFAFIPLILLIMFLPITANGIGTGQAAFLWLFSRVGTPRDEAFALSILFIAPWASSATSRARCITCAEGRPKGQAANTITP